ncbi:MAG: AmmeMemoRadiSam system protein A [Bacillota bacterium]|nr:AmmeMemoRadiSam system protein A [Bacillota bacterium]
MTAHQRGLVFGGLVPHPPIIIPEVGGGDIGRAARTVEGMRRFAAELVRAAPQTVIIVGPHGPVMSRAFAAVGGATLEGDFADFGAPQVRLRWQGDVGLLRDIKLAAGEAGLEVAEVGGAGGSAKWQGVLDYATLVPLYYLHAAGYSGRVVPLSMAVLDYRTCYRFGQSIAAAAARSGRLVALVASGDLSHRLKPGAPAGFDEKAGVFDRTVVDALAAGDASKLLDMDRELIRRAGECGLRPLLIMLGGVVEAGLQPQVLSYEGPFGVGYAVVAFRRPDGSGGADGAAGARGEGLPDASDGTAGVASAGAKAHPLVELARSAIDAYVREGRVVEPPAGVAPEASLPERAGAFVSLRKRGELRGCIGTIAPTRPTLGEEVIHNAIAAAADDPRFDPVDAAELAALEISVDVLGPAEPVSGFLDLDPKRYGVIVEKETRRGLLLPDLEGVDTPAQQVAIACRKAGLTLREPGIRMYRFEVVRYR